MLGTHGRSLAYALGLSLLLAAGCKGPRDPNCIGEPACLGQWAVFADQVGEGQPCTTASGDLHVRYEARPTEVIVRAWSVLIRERLRVELDRPWGGTKDYQQGIYLEPKSGRRLNVQVVPTSGSLVRTLRMSWE